MGNKLNSLSITGKKNESCLSYRQLKAGKKIPKAKEKDSTFLDMGNSRYCRKMIPIELLDILSMMIS